MQSSLWSCESSIAVRLDFAWLDLVVGAIRLEYGMRMIMGHPKSLLTRRTLIKLMLGTQFCSSARHAFSHVPKLTFTADEERNRLRTSRAHRSSFRGLDEPRGMQRRNGMPTRRSIRQTSAAHHEPHTFPAVPKSGLPHFYGLEAEGAGARDHATHEAATDVSVYQAKLADSYAGTVCCEAKGSIGRSWSAYRVP